jgi:MTH538 TIR-like domain (DUF1863)
MAHTCYTCFDADNDIHYYRLMQAWHANERFDFTFVNAHDITQARDTSSEETIKRSLRLRMNASDIMIVLIGNSTRNLYRFVRWEMEVALEKDMPIIAVNLNGFREQDASLCPPILRDELAIHIPFAHRIIDYAIKNWPVTHRRYTVAGKTGSYYYLDNVYQELGI